MRDKKLELTAKTYGGNVSRGSLPNITRLPVRWRWRFGPTTAFRLLVRSLDSECNDNLLGVSLPPLLIGIIGLGEIFGSVLKIRTVPKFPQNLWIQMT